MDTRGLLSLLLLTHTGTLLCPLSTSAQDPDTTSAWRYFPLAVGNTWEYEHWSESSGGGGSILLGYLRWTVEDTTEQGGQHYFVVRKERYDPDREFLPDSLEVLPVRFDTRSSRLFALDSTGSEGPWPFEFSCPLNAPFDAFIVCDERKASTDGSYEHLIDIGEDSIDVGFKSFIVHNTPFEYIYGYAADVGLFSHQWYAGNTYWEWYDLQYVRVEGVEYGEPTGVAIESHAPSEPSDPTLSVWPNPFRASTEIRFSLPEPSDVRLVIYDLLGREAARLVDKLMPAGTHQVRFDGTDLPAGVYLCRLEAGAHTGLARMTRLR